MNSQNTKCKHQHFMGVLLGAAFILVVGLVIGSHFKPLNDSKPEINANHENKIVSDPLSSVKCAGYDAEVHYLDFTSTLKDISELKERGKNSNNIFILCDPAGSGAFVDVYVFRNNEMIFKSEGIYKGKVFFDEGNVLNVFKGAPKEGDANCCPSAYELERFKYDSKEEIMKSVETKNYTAEQYKGLNIE